MATRRSSTYASLASALALAAVSCSETPPRPDPRPLATEGTFEVVEGWPRLPPGRSFGRVLGVAVAPDGRVWVSHTADGEARNEQPIPGATLAVLDPETGDVVEELGRGLFRLPHALAFDDAGHLWVTDADANLIFVLDQAGSVLARIGAE